MSLQQSVKPSRWGHDAQYPVSSTNQGGGVHRQLMCSPCVLSELQPVPWSLCKHSVIVYHAAVISRCAISISSPPQCTQNCSSKGARSLQTLALVRGGGGGNEAPVFTLLMRVFLPKYGRESETEEGGLDLEGGGLMRRLGRLVTGVFLKVLGSSSDSDTKGGRDDLDRVNPSILL